MWEWQFCSWKNEENLNLVVQSEEIKRDPEMDKSAVWAGSGCMAVFLFPGHV